MVVVVVPDKSVTENPGNRHPLEIWQRDASETHLALNSDIEHKTYDTISRYKFIAKLLASIGN